jgi:hypothetical protein
LVGLQTIRLNGRVIRVQPESPEAGAALAVEFRDVPLRVRERIEELVQESLERRGEPCVVVSHPDVGALGHLVDELALAGCQSIRAYRPGEAVAWFKGNPGRARAAVVARDLGPFDGLDVLELMGRTSSAARGVLLCDHAEKPAILADSNAQYVDTVLSIPPSTEALADAIASVPPPEASECRPKCRRRSEEWASGRERRTG